MNHDQVLGMIKTINERHKAVGLFPYAATLVEVIKESGVPREELRLILLELWKEKKIKLYKTLNDVSFEVI